ncbi:hypothetical protein SAMN04488020_106195 [Palleronia marisminoris]|uniref:DUF1127 domain-containing protein n=1 Tax=Palleronia marisminoris TaxID=315423 RepID=A0A1Y5SZG3_9RHOB|nr:hypothetical protein [Palleronia marisminoris]SFH08576.1 hypothetical protein SAMN04488020_106195 [Palleronia marisminoris]SLN52265.1 hypothetical protein PAM7066_02429 [Palleronia marisminoris]
MAYIRTHAHHDGPGIFARIGHAVATWFVEVMESSSRFDQIERLQRKSDDQLAEMGLRRDEIVRHVFRDRMMY